MIRLRVIHRLRTNSRHWQSRAEDGQRIVYERAAVWITDSKGVRKRKDFYAKTKRELERKVRAAEAIPARTSDTKMTVAAYFMTVIFLE